MLQQLRQGLTGIRDFFVGSVAELKKVEWLTRQETIRFSLFVISVTIAASIFIAILDLLFFRGLNLILN